MLVAITVQTVVAHYKLITTSVLQTQIIRDPVYTQQ